MAEKDLEEEKGLANHFGVSQIILVIIFLILIAIALYFLLTGNIPGFK